MIASLIAILDSGGVAKHTLELILNYLSRRKQRTKTGSLVCTMNDIKDQTSGVLYLIFLSIIYSSLFTIFHHTRPFT